MTGEARHNHDYEQYVLGAVLQSAGKVLPELPVTSDDFYRPQHMQLWDLFTTMHAQGEPVEMMSVFGRLQATPIRGISPADLHTIEASCTSWTNANYYAAKVSALARLRRVQEAASRGMQLASTAEETDVDSVVEAVRSAIDAAGRDTETGPGDLPSFGSLMLASMDRWESPDDDILPTGLYDLDRKLLGGLRKGHLMIVGARPSVGKSVVASVVAHTVASRGTGVLFASLEMSRDEVVDRVIADVASVELERLTMRRLTEHDWDRVSKVTARVADWPLYVDDRAKLSVSALRGRARDVSRRCDLGLVVIDYLQLMKPLDERVARQEQVASISRALKLAAKDLRVPIIALAQVNRAAVQRQDKRPMMSDLRESGAIEADADEVVLLHRDDKELPGCIEFAIEKNRHGQTGRIEMAWAPHYARVSSLSRNTS